MTATPAANPDTQATREMLQLVPALGPVGMAQVVAELVAAPVAEPFADSRVAFVADLSRYLRRNSGGRPEIEALAFWMRPAEIARLQASFEQMLTPRLMLMPRGTVFHIPPANVDTIFVYSLVLALLTGNRNLVRLSSRTLDSVTPLLEAIEGVGSSHNDVAQGLKIVTYGHDDAVTAELTNASDVRVVWGGDATIMAVRRVPLPPHATELVFADRFSLAAIDIVGYRALDDKERDQLAERFVNDAYWFDQLGCSSPRLLIWVGSEDFRGHADDFHRRVRIQIRRKGYAVDTSSAIAKISQAYRSMIDTSITDLRWYENSEVVLDAGEFPEVRGDFCGGGLFYQWAVPTLNDLVPHIRRTDQTLAVHGFASAELRDFATRLVGSGIDRIVPIGQALQFNRFWDGYDLLREFTRTVTLPRDSWL